MKRFVSVLLSFVVVCSCIICFPTISANSATTSQQNIVGWADYYYDITWTAQKTVSGWKGNYTYYQGNSYRLPYGQPVTQGKYIGYGVSIDDFISATKDANSAFYSTKSYYSGYSSNSVYYSTDCSAFVSLCWGIPRSTTSSIPSRATGLGKLSSSTVNSLQIGDCLNSTSAGHVVLVTDVTYSGGTVTSVEITEQTPPQLKRTTYSASSLVSYYGARGYYIYRYNGTVPTPPSQKPEDNYVDLGTDFYAYIEHQNTGLFLTNQNTNVAGEAPTGKSNQIWKFIRQPNGAYALQSNLNGYYMDVYALDEDNTNVYTWSEYLNTSNQQFYVYYEYGAYYFRPAHSSTRRLDMSSTEDHNLSIWGAGEDWAPQEFNIVKIDVNGNLPIDMGTEFYSYIEHQNTGLYLTNQNTNVAGESPTGNQNQIWKFVRQANGSYSIQSVSNGYYLDVYGSFDENDTNVYTWSEYTGATNQQFYIYDMYDAHYIRPAFTDSKMLDMSTVNNNLEIWVYGSDWAPQEFNIIKIDVLKNLPITLGDNFYARIENIATHKVLSVVGNNVEGLDKNCDKQQIWNFIRQPNNSYKIISCFDSGAMDVQDYAVTGSGTNIQINVDWDTTAQLFFIYDMYDAFYIKPQCSDMVLDMSQTTYNLEVWDVGIDWPAQKFSIEKIERDEIGVHNYTSKVIESATCTADGIKTYTCSICGDTYTETIPATGHTEVVDKGYEATYEKEGLTDGLHCSVCDKVLVEQEIIPILVMIGDVDGDGKVSIMDATEIQRHIAQLTTISDARIACADTDKDGKVSIMDATQIQRFIAQLIPEL